MDSRFSYLVRSSTLNYDGGLSGSLEVIRSKKSFYLTDTLWLDSKVHSTSFGRWVESSDVFVTNRIYKVIVDGNWGYKGNSGPPIIYDSPGDTYPDRASHDADVSMAGDAVGHAGAIRFNLGSGFSHIEPEGGPYTTPPNSMHEYTWLLEGQGSKFQAAISDSPISDNNGQMRIRIYSEGL